jgi:uncharacterized protein with PQ loop repeat
MELNYVELIGYAASALVLASFFMKNIRTLRIVNCFGCFFFIIYGVLLESIPIIITNVAILAVNIYYLFLKKEKVVEAEGE